MSHTIILSRQSNLKHINLKELLDNPTKNSKREHGEGI